jgi:hypothetical protein
MSEPDRPYDARSIRILSDVELIESFDWAKATALSIQYGKDPKWIERGLAACQAVGVSQNYFIQRYLVGDRSVPIHEGVDAAFREMWIEKVVSGRR